MICIVHMLLCNMHAFTRQNQTQVYPKPKNPYNLGILKEFFFQRIDFLLFFFFSPAVTFSLKYTKNSILSKLKLFSFKNMIKETSSSFFCCFLFGI